ncbi:hypothetical protein J5N97_000078 [Dioscorea zingiberensis]|uniref:Uncharacterized protein n=1 Tax=Dioscorea zingiberensis TaxID=325984 RepID=A0A9D5BVS5_9LILI|nr:hypothetical protein J5N97_000078 [Dioscorea zingiberensis]
MHEMVGRERGSVMLFVCFGSWCYLEDEQLREMALGLEARDGVSPVLRGDGEHPKTEWMPEGWEERVQGKGLVVKGLGFREANADVASPALDHFITEVVVERCSRLELGVWDGFRSTFEKEKVVVPAEAIERAVRKFTEGSGEGEEMRKRAAKWAEIAAVAEGGSSHKDLNSLIDDLFVLQRERKNGKHIE